MGGVGSCRCKGGGANFLSSRLNVGMSFLGWPAVRLLAWLAGGHQSEPLRPPRSLNGPQPGMVALAAVGQEAKGDSLKQRSTATASARRSLGPPWRAKAEYRLV